jgi:hypothetical protein
VDEASGINHVLLAIGSSAPKRVSFTNRALDEEADDELFSGVTINQTMDEEPMDLRCDDFGGWLILCWYKS